MSLTGDFMQPLDGVPVFFFFVGRNPEVQTGLVITTVTKKQACSL